jgi:hypothetical protein
MSPEEVAHLKRYLSQNPTAGDLLVGTGGARKFRFGAPGRGKRGRYRIITYYCDEDIPVFLMDVYAKGEKVNLSTAERAALKEELRSFADEYRAMVTASISRGIGEVLQ